MFLGTPTPEFLQTTTEAIARFIQWIAELIRRRNWFMLLVLTGVALAALGGFFRDQINERFLAEAAQGAVWASFWTGVALIFIGALVVAVVTMPRPGQEPEDDSPERKAIKGLRPFSRDDAEIFTRLQRTSSLRECCETVTSQSYKFGILMGESGCGKTSFLQAGLWPKLSLPDSSHGAVYVRFSDQEPLETIRQAVADQLEVPVEWLTGTAVEPSHGAAFVHVLTQVRQAADRPIVLLFDQFEQVFVHNPRKDDRAPFVQAMTAWYKTSALDTVKVLVSIRADLLHELYELQEALGYSLGPQDLFKLERFTPEEASRILGVIAETERLDFDPRFVQELAERELAHRESGTISPVDLQILAWMIERQQGDDVRAFNRMAFQKFGGVEGLLSRFLDRTLDARALPQQREAAVKTLLALTDLERQVRSGVLTVAELQDMLKATAKPDDVAEAVAWLSRGDVRLITPQDKAGHTAYELAHERLIPALMRLADRELTAADKANQLLERRVNEWLGNQQQSRYLLTLRELLLIRRQRPYLRLGSKRKQKEALIRLSQRRMYVGVTAISTVLVAGLVFFGWFGFTPSGQIQQVRWELSRQVGRVSLSSDITSSVAVALIKDNQHRQGLKVIDDHIDNRPAKANALTTIATTAVRLADSELLRQALTLAQAIDLPESKSSALRALALAYKDLDDRTTATNLLEASLQAARQITDPSSQSWALSAIARASVELDSRAAVEILEEALQVTQQISDPGSQSIALRAIARAYVELDSRAAVEILEEALQVTQQISEPWSQSYTLREIAGASMELDSRAAVEILEEALQVTRQISEPRDQSNALSAIAGAYVELDSSAAMEILEEALKVTQQITDPSSQSWALIAIAGAYVELDSSAAMEILEEALKVTQQITEPWSQSDALSAIARVSVELDDSAAMAILEETLQVAQQITDSNAQSSALSAIAGASVELDRSAAIELLEETLQVAQQITEPNTQSNALIAIANASIELDSSAAMELLEELLQVAQQITEPSSQSRALSSITTTVRQMGDEDIARTLLGQLQPIAQQVRASSILRDIATFHAFHGDWFTALQILRTCEESDRLSAFAEILTYHAEQERPQLIEGPVVLAVAATVEPSGAVQLQVTLQSPDRDCDRHADWWEVLSDKGELIDRYLIDGPHGFEKPFTTNKTLTRFDLDQTILVRAHFSDDIDGVEVYGSDRYSTQAMKGKVNDPESFTSIRLSDRFARQVEKQGEQPQDCTGDGGDAA